MSYTEFHTPTGTAYVSGAERAHLDMLIRDRGDGLRRVAFAGHPPAELQYARTIHLPDAGEAVLDINVNSILSAGDPPVVQLATRIGAQCEVHGFVDGADRAWFADLIDEAVDAGVFRAEMSCYPQRGEHPNGWRAVAGFARADAADPIVMSYSVCDSFPNPDLAVWPDDPPEDEPADWVGADPLLQWDWAMAGLRRKAEVSWLLQITPDNLGDACFGQVKPMTWGDVAAAWPVPVS